MNYIIQLIEFILIIYLLITVSNIKSQISSGVKKSVVVKKDEEVRDEVVVESPRSSLDLAVENPVEQFFKWFARDWPLKVGAVFILLGVGWFLTYAFMNNLIGPLGRLLIGLIGGAIVMVVGNLRIKKNIYQGEILAVLGAGILLATVFASEHVYTNLVRTLYPSWVSLILVTFVIAALTFTSYMYKTIRLAALAFLVGALAPVIIGAPRGDVVLIFGYLLALTLGFIWLVRLTGWRQLIIMPLATVIIFTIVYKYIFQLTPDQRLWMEFFSATFTTVFYLSSLMAFAYEKSKDQKDMIVGVLFSLYCFIWIISFVSEINKSLIFVLFAVIFMTGAYILKKMESVDGAVYLYFIVSVLFLVVATFLQIKDVALLPIALAVEALMLFIFSDRMYSARSSFFISLLFIPPILFSLSLFNAYAYSIPSYGGYNSTQPLTMGLGLNPSTVVQRYDIQLIFINIMLYAGAAYAYLFQKHKEIITIGKLLFVGATIYALYYVWTAVPYYLKLMQSAIEGKIVVLAIFAIIGLAAYFYGISAAKLWTKRFGLILACFVIARLLLFEIWSMSIPAKIITFIVVGVIFMLSVFIQVSMHEKKIN